MLKHYLPLLNGLDDAAAWKLLYPDNPQDVPHAIELLSSIIAIAKINPTLPPCTPLGSTPDVNVVADFEALRFLGHMFENLLELFINIKMLLFDQITCLSYFAHLLYTFYRDQCH